MNVLIVDDEELSRRYISDLMDEYGPEDRIVGSVNSVAKAHEILTKEVVDVVFLDIQMPVANGFSLLDNLSHRKFLVIFVTAYNQYALKAIKQQAFDYLLKPIDKEEFCEAVKKAKHKLYDTEVIQPSPIDYLNQKLSVHHLNGFKVITLKDVIRLEASNNYTILHLVSGEKIVVSKPLLYFEKQLRPDWFLRIHKSHIINIEYIDGYLSEDGGYALLQSGEKICVSRYKTLAFHEAIQKYTKGLKA